LWPGWVSALDARNLASQQSDQPVSFVIGAKAVNPANIKWNFGQKWDLGLGFKTATLTKTSLWPITTTN